MKHLQLRNAFTLKALLLIGLLVSAVSGAWAEESTSTLTFTAACGGSGTADDDVAWTVTSDGEESSYEDARGIHYGTGSKKVKYINLTTSGISGTITKVVVNASTASGVSATVGVTVGGKAFGGDAQSLSSSAANYTFNGSASGEIVVTVTKPSSATKALYVKSVAVTYTTGGSSLEECDLALTGAPIALTFDMYNNSEAQYISYTTSSTGEITAESNDAVSCYADPEKKTISVTPFASTNGEPLVITLNQAADENYKAGSVTFTVTVTDATPITTHKAVFSVNGATTEQEFAEGAAIEFPATPDNIYGKAFVGWTHFPISGTTDVAPTIYTSATMGDSDVFFYAVYANASGEISNKSVTINSGTTGLPTSYGTANTFTEYTLGGEKFQIQQVYLTGGKLQWRAAGNSSGTGTMYNSESFGKITSIVLTYNSSDSNKNFTLKVGNSANPTGGTEVTPSINGSTYTFDCSSLNSGFFVLTNGSGAGYLDGIVINYTVGSATYSDYCTTVEKVATFSYVDYQGKGEKDYGASYTMIQTDVRISHNKFYGSDTYPNAYFYGYGDAGEGVITITPTGGATITKIEITTTDTEHNGYQVVDEKAGEIIPSVGEVTANNEDKTKATVTTWTGSASEQFTITNTRTIVWSSIKVYYIGGLPKCATPAISGETPFVTYSTVTISCDTEGATIQYSTSTDGVNYTAYQTYTGPFQVSQTTQVKAQATKEGMVPSDEAYKLFTQQGAIPNIGYFISSHANNPFTDPEYLLLEDALVTFKNGTTAYIKDAYRAVMLYNCAGDLEAGDKINGYMKVTGYTVYNGLPEITGFELVEGYTKTSGNEVTPTVMTLAELLGGAESSPYEMYLSEYVKIENATVISAFDKNNCTIEQGGQTIILRDQNSTSTLSSNVNDIVTVTGHVAIYNSTKQIAVYVQDQIVAGEAPADPTITVTPSSLTGLTYMVEDGPSVAQTISVSGTNLTSDITLTMGDKKFEMSLTEDDGYASSLTLTPSDGAVAATTIYVRLRAGLEVNASYSGSIAIASTGADSKSVTLTGSVTEYVPDYAKLPFAFDGGKADIESTTGLTQNGLGSDYKSSPFLKFDGTGDALVLKINERPGTLTFDIKGNGFSGGTFTVQTSEDGKTYTDLESYTELGDTQNESFDNLGENVRYIKWIYTNKSDGNVAIGNINLAAYVASDTRLDPELSYATTSYEINFGDEFTAPTLTNPYNLKGITYACSKPEVVEVDEETGEISRIRAAGTFTITATFAGDETYKEGSASYTLTVTDKRIATTVSCESIVLDIANIGSLTRLAPVVKDADDNVISYFYDDWPTEMSFEVVADDNYMIGSIDWNTGEITLNAVAGTVTLKALYNHYNVNSTYQPSECTFTITVVDPSAITYYALVSEKNGIFYAINSTFTNNSFKATEVDAVNGKVITPQTDNISWNVEAYGSGYGLQSKATNSYIGGTASDAKLTNPGTIVQWMKDDEGGFYIGTRYLLYSITNKYFRNYAKSNIDSEYYSGRTKAYIFADGYTRDIKTTTWGTICLTNTVAADDYSGVTFYSIKGKTVDKDGNPTSLVLKEETGELLAGVAYIFQTNEGATKLIAAYSDETIDEPFSAAVNKGLEGSFTGTAVKAGMYLLSGGKIIQCGEDCSIGPNRAFINMDEVPDVTESESGVKLFIGGEDGVSSLDAATEGAVIYDLSGRRVSKTAKGLYIVNGKKVSVK